ncbi:MAG: glycine zipper domain-containing protein [Gemmatimonadota bacterium]
MGAKGWGDPTRQTSMGVLTILGFAALVGACGDRVVEEETPPAVDMGLALEPDAEPELADVGDAHPAEAEMPPAEAPHARTPRAETSPPAHTTQASPVRGVPPAATVAPPEDLEPSGPRMVTITAPVGAELEAELLQELSTKFNQPGDTFQLRVTSPLMDGNRVIVQRNAYISGEVTAVQESGRSGETAVIKVAFHEVSFLGETWPISATVVEAELTTKGRYSTGDKAARIGAGAAAGAILGRVIGGNSTGTVVGAAVGAAAGTAITLATEDVDAVMAEGTIFRLRLDKPLTIVLPVNDG